MKLGETPIQDVYRFFNGRYFRHRLPDIPVKWKKYLTSRNFIGRTVGDKNGPQEIHLNPYYKKSDSVWLRTLLHEMVHVELWHLPAKQVHGRKFENRMKVLAARGAFHGLW